MTTLNLLIIHVMHALTSPPTRQAHDERGLSQSTEQVLLVAVAVVVVGILAGLIVAFIRAKAGAWG